ncbi:Uncharacterised protein [Candidatus Gugararchaeum adminiculabundum]|nr:Uncharacterised protein [Candidatus Gugararchaeum adminiculabundum]
MEIDIETAKKLIEREQCAKEMESHVKKFKEYSRKSKSSAGTKARTDWSQLAQGEAKKFRAEFSRYGELSKYFSGLKFGISKKGARGK